MPEIYNNVWCVSVPEIVEAGILTAEACHKYITRYPHVRARRPAPGKPTLLYWDYLRTDIKQKYTALKGDPTINGAANSLRNSLTPDPEAMEFFGFKFKLPNGKSLKAGYQQEYCTNAMVLNALAIIANKAKAKHNALNNGRVTGIWETYAQTVAALKPDVPHTLPEHPKRLKLKLEQYQKLSYMSLVSGKFLNNNAAKVIDPEQEATLRQLLRHHNNLDSETISGLYNVIAGGLEWDKITGSTVDNYRKKWDFETISGRKGEAAFNNTVAMTVKRKAPVYPLYYWTVDGWDVELLYQRTELDAKGNTRTTYHNRLCMVVILDPCNKYPIGYAIGTHETPELIKAAMRNAISHTKELFGDYYKVLQLQTDNYAKKSLTPVYEVLSDHYTPARAHNAKAKVIEPYFRWLNDKFFKLMPNWSGYGVASGSKRQPNAEYMNKIRHNFPDEFGCRHQITQIMEQVRALSREKYLKAFSEMPAEDKKPIRMDEFLMLTGKTTGLTNRFGKDGIVVTINGEKHSYDSFDVNFRRHLETDWVIRYNPDDCTQVLATSQEGDLRFLLSEKYVQPMALRERKPGDAGKLQKVLGYNDDLRKSITAGMAEDYNVMSDMFDRNPQLNGTLAKFVLVDSNGQHKDNKSAERLGQAKKVIQKQERRELQLQERSWAERQEEYCESKVDLAKYLNQ